MSTLAACQTLYACVHLYVFGGVRLGPHPCFDSWMNRRCWRMNVSPSLTQTRMDLRAMKSCLSIKSLTSGEQMHIKWTCLPICYGSHFSCLSFANFMFNFFVCFQCLWQAWSPVSFWLWPHWEECGALFQLLCQAHLWWQPLHGW